ncbi:ribosome biogenesis GTPase Der, partial [archaeon]
MEFTAMDTGGLEDGATRDAIEAKMKDHTARAIQHADAVLFVVDYRNGVTEEDLKFVRCVCY